MLDKKEVLSSVLRQSQMGQVGIRSVLKADPGPAMRSALEIQLKEYGDIEAEAYSIASQRGWDLTELGPGIRSMTAMVTRMKLSRRRTDAKIADMMIQGTTRGVIKSLRTIHHFPFPDSAPGLLSRKLLDKENQGIRRMQTFL